jgi:hypothetical protein
MSRIRNLPQTKQALLEALAGEGDMVAMALVQMASDFVVTQAAKVGTTIAVTLQLVDGVGASLLGVQNVMLTSKSNTPASMSVTTGTEISGGGSDEVWAQTNASGQIVVNVTDATSPEQLLLQAIGPDGNVSLTVLQF